MDPSPTSVIDADDANFEHEVLERSRQVPVLVDFWAPWCGPCRMLGPILEKLVSARQGEMILAKVNIDESQQLATRYRVESIPLVIAFRDGKPVNEFMGLLPESQVRMFLDTLAPTQADRLAGAAAALENAKPEEAAALYRRALDDDRNHETARIGLARLLIALDKDNEASELLQDAAFAEERAEEAERLNGILFLRRLARTLDDEATVRQRLEAEPNNARTRYELGAIEAAKGNYAQALDLLFGAGERDSSLAMAKVREVMVNVFNVIGVRSALADEYREKLTTLLY